MATDGVASRAAHGRSVFPAIADYAFLSDGETTALVAPSGNVEWLCLPRMDCPSVFGAILDRAAGMFRLGPPDVRVPAARRYLPGTVILETSWDAPGGWIIVRDALLIGPWHHPAERSHTHRRTPTAVQDRGRGEVERLPAVPQAAGDLAVVDEPWSWVRACSFGVRAV
jgi:GH15 family glucan-1,4-alpha-glucosidase